jgi:uncharacterized protein YigE (DUF2233 family)
MRTALAALALIALSGCQAQAGSEEEAVAASSPAASACRPVMFEETPLTHCMADPEQHRVRVVLGPTPAKPYRSLAALAADRPADAAPVAFAMNGGMYDAEGAPIGYYVEKGERLQRLNRADGPGNFHLKPNGVFFGTGREWAVLSSDAFYDTVEKRPAFATQSGPMLVIDGALHDAFEDDGESKKIRNAVGVDQAGRAHFVISEAPVSFGKLARYFRDELKTPNALFLDGSVSQLWDPARDRIDGGVPLGPLIVVEKLAKAAPEKSAP